MRFLGKSVEPQGVEQLTIEFGFEDIENVYASDDVMYVGSDGWYCAIFISSIYLKPDLVEGAEG